MPTTVTAAKIGGMNPNMGGYYEGLFQLTSDTTDASGQMTLDLTAHYTKVYSIEFGGMTATAGYFLDIEKPLYTAAITSTNIKLGVYEAGADAAALDPVGSADMSTLLAGLVITVKGEAAIV